MYVPVELLILVSVDWFMVHVLILNNCLKDNNTWGVDPENVFIRRPSGAIGSMYVLLWPERPDLWKNLLISNNKIMLLVCDVPVYYKGTFE